MWADFLQSYPASSSTAAPGPTGNACDIPREHSWITYRDWSTEYGRDVVAARVSDHTLVVLNSYTAATDLLEKRSSIYLNRPVLVLAEPWRRLDPNVRVETYGDDWREGRRLLREHVQPSAVQQFLHRLLESQSDLDDSIKLSVCKTVRLTATYGIPAEEIGTQYVDILHGADEGLSEAFNAGVFLVEFISWLHTVQCALRRAVQGCTKGGENMTKDIAGTAFLAGTDTTSETLFAFFCAMPVVLHPEVQQRAQLELDAVVGRDRLPEHADRPSSHYISAIAQEALAGTIPLLWGSLTGPQRRINIVAGRPEREL
ncbi:cytochrome P450 [Cubamyces menziesii]|nr:cytochrome P450 [Cubamyces menziesii]